MQIFYYYLILATAELFTLILDTILCFPTDTYIFFIKLILYFNLYIQDTPTPLHFLYLPLNCNPLYYIYIYIYAQYLIGIFLLFLDFKMMYI